MIDQLRAISPSEQAAVDDFEGRIRERYPEATFEVQTGGEPDGVYPMATIDHDNSFDVLDHIIERMVEIQVDEGLPVYVVPSRP